jgi:hypothetical protein
MRPSGVAAPAGCPAMTTRTRRAPATAQPHGRIEAGAISAAQERSWLAQVSENEGCGTLVTKRRYATRGRLRPEQGWNRRRCNGRGFSTGFSCFSSRTGAGLSGGTALPRGPAPWCRIGGVVVSSARDGALRRAALPGQSSQHHTVEGAGLRVSFPKPPVPVVRWNLTGGDCTCMAIPSSGVAARTRGWRWRPPGPSRRKRHCVSTAPGRWPCWGSASYQQHSCRKVQSVPPEDGDPE